MPRKSGIGRRSKGKMMGKSSYKRKPSPSPLSSNNKKKGYILSTNVMTCHNLTQYIGKDFIEMGSRKVIRYAIFYNYIQDVPIKERWHGRGDGGGTILHRMILRVLEEVLYQLKDGKEYDGTYDQSKKCRKIIIQPVSKEEQLVTTYME